MKQNIYDSPQFFERYMEYRRNPLCLNNTLEQPALLSVLPSLQDMRVLDIGCGAGSFCVEAARRGASSVIGIDISKLMCTETARTVAVHDDRVKIINQAIEDAEFGHGSFDVIISSLTLHYVADFADVVSRISEWLSPSGEFIFSVNHPIYTADLDRVPDFGTGTPLTLSLERYQDEGIRKHYWFVEGVIKYHRTLQTHFALLHRNGFRIKQFLEPQVLLEFSESTEELRNANRRPVFMIISVDKV